MMRKPASNGLLVLTIVVPEQAPLRRRSATASPFFSFGFCYLATASNEALDPGWRITSVIEAPADSGQFRLGN